MFYELESPLLDPVTINKETWQSTLPQMEKELNDAELDAAVNLNKGLMLSLKWGDYINQVIDKLNTQVGIYARDQFTRDIKFDLLAKGVDRYQGAKKITGDKKGVLDINTWSVLQEDLGFFDFRFVRINEENAIKANKYYKDQVWGKHLNFILQYFVRLNIIKNELPLNGKYFALAIAKWQSQDDHIRNIPKGVDGILGPKSWDILRTEIEAVSAPYEVRAHIKMGDTKEASRRFVEVMGKLGEKIKNNLNNIQTKVVAEIGNEKEESSMLREGVYLSADALMDLAGETPAGKIAGALGKIALGLVKKHYEEKEAEQRRQAILSRTFSFADVILQAMNAVTYLPDQTRIQHEFDDTISSIRWTKKGAAAEKEVQAEFNKLLDYITALEETVKDDQKIMRIALSNVMNIYSPHARVFVHCQNSSNDIEDWEQSDIYTIINDPGRKHLFFYFTNVHARVGAEDSLSENRRKILNFLWGIWTQNRFPLNQLSVEKDVFLRVNFFERVHSYSVFKSAVPYDVYVKSVGKNEGSWTDSNDVLGRIDRTLFFRKEEEYKTYGIDTPNSKGLTYKNIILEIVNKVMQKEYNSGIGSYLSYIESEAATEITSSEVYGSYEAAEIHNETIAEVFSRQKAVSSTTSFLSLAKNNQAINANKANVTKSGLNLTDIITTLDKYIDYGAIRKAMQDFNQKNPSNSYSIDNASAASVDAVFTEAVHQFQVAAYIDLTWQDGVIGPSTLDTLGLSNHQLKQKLNTTDFYGQHQLNRKDVKDKVSQQTNGTYTASNWFDFILRPAWLGVPITDGVHVLLLEKLRQAETWLLSQSQYAGMTPAGLGRALGFNAKSRYSASRLSSDNQAMHGLGLAIDINVWGNPWIGAGWISNDKVSAYQERYRMIQALRKASGNSSLTGKTIFAYLDSIAQTNGDGTTKAYEVLKQRNDEFVAYLKNTGSEFSYWKASYTFGGRDPKDGFLNLHADLVYALRNVAELAWGAMDFGPYASGDIMHFDTRTIGVSQFICKMIGGHVPSYGHPSLNKKTSGEYEAYYTDNEFYNGPELHEALGEAKWGEENEYVDLLISDETSVYAHEDYVTTRNWAQAAQSNRQYASSLGWGQYTDAINNLLLPYSGATDQSLGEEAFAQALASWQSAQGFSAYDSDGILGPATWRVIKPMVVPKAPVISLPIDVPSVQNIFDFNRWHAQKIINNMDAGILCENFHSKDQLQNIVNGEKINVLDPQSKILQILPVMYHISEQAKMNNDNEIIFGSFIRKPDSDGSCTGHCAGNCIDINHKSKFDSHDTTLMVLRILNYLTTLPSQYRHGLGFGMPLQGEFFGHSNFRKFHSVPPSNLINPQLQQIVPTIGIVFPDNDNHLHIQVFWK